MAFNERATASPEVANGLLHRVLVTLSVAVAGAFAVALALAIGDGEYGRAWVVFLLLGCLLAGLVKVVVGARRRSRTRSRNEEGKRAAPSAGQRDLVRLTVALEHAMRWEKLYREPLTLQDLAAHLGESRHRVSEALNEGVGESFYSYINRFRVLEAQQLLRANDGRSVAEVAEYVGFQTIHTFNRAFKRFSGTTPSKYRRSHSPATAALSR